MKNLIQTSEVIVCIGSGGVGKTTLAAAIGYSAALAGKKVLVLTIDPSQRLKTTLGIDETKDRTEVPIAEPLTGAKGSLTAAVINPKKTFDDFVRRASKIEELSKKILNNKLYVQLSTTLNGSQEFTALERLYSEKESGRYDLIVLDTPPSKHVIDFLEAPQKLAAIFNDGIAKWLRQPKFTSSLFQFGTKKVLKALEMLTGSEFVRELSDFFANIHTWQDKLEERIASVHQLLISDKTRFVLVTGFDSAKLKEAEFLFAELKRGGYSLNTVVLNRAYPLWFKKWFKAQLAANPSTDKKTGMGSKLGLLHHQMTEYYTQRRQEYEDFAGRQAKVSGSSVKLITIPELDFDISDLAGIKKLSHYVEDPEV